MTQDENPDLRSALGFVIGRITEEANRAGEPLDEDEEFLLSNLPRSSSIAEWVDPEFPLVPRDLAFEKLCRLALAAHSCDLALGPELERRWSFVSGVLKLHGHPMYWLLQWSGLKVRPRWDRWLLVLAALLLTILGLAAMFYAVSVPSNRVRWTLVVCSSVFFLLLLQLSRKFERWQLRRTVERCRGALSDSY